MYVAACSWRGFNIMSFTKEGPIHYQMMRTREKIVSTFQKQHVSFVPLNDWSVCPGGRASVSLSVRDRNQSSQQYHFLFVSVRTAGSRFTPLLKSASSPSSMLSHWYRQASEEGSTEIKYNVIIIQYLTMQQ